MYAGTTFRNKSGHIVGVHQRIDRAARKSLKNVLTETDSFPVIKDILHFEGNNGPDGIKRKNPSKDEPWHFIDPFDDTDNKIIEYINNHISNLSLALKQQDNIKASFEAAWLAHAIVDGLTPAHHYALDEKIESLWGKPHYERLSIKEKNIIKGINRRDTISKNWQYWGFKGVFTAHIAFELGVASTIATLRLNKISPSIEQYRAIENNKYEKLFRQTLNEIAALDMYNRFAKLGWTHKLARETKSILVPEIIRMVTLAWYKAVLQARK